LVGLFEYIALGETPCSRKECQEGRKPIAIRKHLTNVRNNQKVNKDMPKEHVLFFTAYFLTPLKG